MPSSAFYDWLIREYLGLILNITLKRMGPLKKRPCLYAHLAHVYNWAWCLLLSLIRLKGLLILSLIRLNYEFFSSLWSQVFPLRRYYSFRLDVYKPYRTTITKGFIFFLNIMQYYTIYFWIFLFKNRIVQFLIVLKSFIIFWKTNLTKV